LSVAAPRFRDIINRHHFPALDGIRACAVLAVIFGHHNYPVPAIPADLGVSAFFVLSGFLITRLLMREQEATGDVSLKRFYARRTLRIFPAYYAFLALSFTLDWIQGARWDRWLGVSALTYTVNYYNAFNQHPSNSISHAWSLGVEEQFYLLWPLLFVLLARRSRSTLMAGVGVLAAFAIVRRSLLLAQGASVSYLYNAFDTRFDNLAVGCLVALAADTRTIEAVAETLAQRVWYPLVTLAALLASRNLPATYHYTAGFTVNALLLAVLIVQLLQLHGSRLWSWLEHPVTRYLGAISYPMYLYHQWGDSVGRHTVSGKHPVFWAGLLATVGLATGSYYVLERPFLKLRRFFEVPALKPAAEVGVMAGANPIGTSSKVPVDR
jgi:peptidoglycan/LPS O-acetylase OafA/YrhL